MNAEELAGKLTGIEYPSRIDKAIVAEAKTSNLVIVYGASDDLMEFEGAIREEVDSYEGATVKVDRQGLLPSFQSITEDHDFAEINAERYFERKPHAKEIKAIWDKDGYSWIYETEIPHVTFEVVEGGEKYCRGIVFSLDDLQ